MDEILVSALQVIFNEELIDALKDELEVIVRLSTWYGRFLHSKAVDETNCQRTHEKLILSIPY